MLAETDLGMAGYSGDRVPPMQKRMIQAMEAIPGVEVCGHWPMLCHSHGHWRRDGLSRQRGRPEAGRTQPAHAYLFHISPGYFRAAGTHAAVGAGFLMAGRQELAACSRGEWRVCSQALRFRRRRHRPLLQTAGWNADPGGGDRGRRQILQPDRRPGAGAVCSHPAVRRRSRHVLVVRCEGPGSEQRSTLWARR